MPLLVRPVTCAGRFASVDSAGRWRSSQPPQLFYLQDASSAVEDDEFVFRRSIDLIRGTARQLPPSCLHQQTAHRRHNENHHRFQAVLPRMDLTAVVV